MRMLRGKTNSDVIPVLELFFTSDGYDHGYFEAFLETIGYKALGRLNIKTLDNTDEIFSEAHDATSEPNFNRPDLLYDEVLFREGFSLSGMIKFDNYFKLP